MSNDFADRVERMGAVLERLESSMYEIVAPLKTTAWVTAEPVPFKKRTSGRKIEMTVGRKWGKRFDCAWFRFQSKVPAAAAGRKVVLLIDVNGEACVVDKGGNPVRGLTTVSSNYYYRLGKPGKRVVQIVQKARAGQMIDVWADAGCNDLFGAVQNKGVLQQADVAICLI